MLSIICARDRAISIADALMVSVGTSLAIVTIQLPAAAYTVEDGTHSVKQVRQTSLRVSPNGSRAAYRSPVPFRIRGPHVPNVTVSPIFPEAVLPEPSLSMQLVIRLGERRVYIYRGSTVEVSYPIAIGRQGWETPTGQYEILNMVKDPEWENPFTGDVIPAGPSNPLGDRWIGFWTDGNNFIGFHGTPNEESVGSAASHGCIRMYNHHVRELFNMVALGTPVIVQP